MTTQTLPGPGPTGRRLRVAESAGYVLTGFPVAVAAFVVLLPGLALGLGTLPIVLGVAVLALTLTAAGGFATLERARLDLLLRTRLPRPAYRPRVDGGPGRVVLAAGSDPRRWLDLAHGIVGFPVAVATFAIVVGWTAGAVGGLGYVLWEWSLPRSGEDETLAELIGLGAGRLPDLLLTTALGAVLAVTLPFVVRGCAAVQAGLAWVFLAGHEAG